jgi:hypothetical protein
MVVNFSTCEINQGMRKLIWTLTSIKKKEKKLQQLMKQSDLSCVFGYPIDESNKLVSFF